ncbi:acyl-CoA dehydrogenase family protein [Streptomyces hirsutus]|uniref:acyl-CoA dehydrogenase family protein n=1 Tax=Streptomyces hirsutus TaxID=35620 RepID=UPI003416705A
MQVASARGIGPFAEPLALRRSGSKRANELWDEMADFMVESVFPAEETYERQRREAGDPHALPAVVEELKSEARKRGLWNLFLPSESGLSQFEYAAIAELSGWSLHLAPEAINGQAPDTGNMELLHLFGTDEQKSRWLEPLLDGVIRSAFAMTEPEVASSDATNIETRIQRDGDEYVINGHKWWASGAADARCSLLIVMGKTDPNADTHRQQSMVLVPVDTPGVTNVRSVPVFGHEDQHGHCEITFTDVRAPATNLLGEEGGGFAMAQARLGPGRIHHAMRALGAAERALLMMAHRVQARVAFGKPLAEQGMVQTQIAESRLALDQARQLCHEAAQVIDAEGNKAAAILVSMAKVAVPRAAISVIDAAIQAHGGAGVSDDTPLALMYGWHRAMRIFDGPDEVHLRSVARAELKRAVATAGVGHGRI